MNSNEETIQQAAGMRWRQTTSDCNVIQLIFTLPQVLNKTLALEKPSRLLSGPRGRQFSARLRLVAKSHGLVPLGLDRSWLNEEPRGRSKWMIKDINVERKKSSESKIQGELVGIP